MQRDEKKSTRLQLIYQLEIWKTYIKPILVEIAEKKPNEGQIIKKLQEMYFYTQCSGTYYKNKKSNCFSMNILNQLYKKELSEIFAPIAQFVLDYENKKIEIPLFLQQGESQHTFGKDQIVLLMSLMCLMLVPQKDNFQFIFSEEDWKTIMIVEYMKQQLSNLVKIRKEYPQEQQFKQQVTKLTLRRKVTKQSLEQLLEIKQNLLMLEPKVAHDKQSIEDYFGDCKVDFANRFIGGGSLQSGCVQEEIMFATHPELYTSMLLCEVMESNEAIEFVGYKKYFKNKGYGSTCAFQGQETVKYEYDEKNRAKEIIVGIDAIPYPSESWSLQQYDKICIDREIIKAYTGFAGAEGKNIVTGNWGCGAFNGNIPLKFMIQWVASSLAGKNMIYVPFGYSEKVKDEKLFQKLTATKVKNVYQDIIRLGGKVKDRKLSIMEVLRQEVGEK